MFFSVIITLQVFTYLIFAFQLLQITDASSTPLRFICSLQLENLAGLGLGKLGIAVGVSELCHTFTILLSWPVAVI